ncbi:hypothetical protein cpL1_0452 [Chlamydia pecorum]|uniref:CHLPS 43 kDa protein n=2 Tax=Chlamydia pecorum TaxID=85991 RepID=A0AA40PR69_9CHLA|nr:hypothetical protein cpL1_0452 [Chlamydia pecorum]KZN27648.1 hypothetical protein cpL17_0579 [Chlamydia pecorum]
MFSMASVRAVQPFFDLHPKPTVYMFSSESSRKSWEQRSSSPCMYAVLDVLVRIAKLFLALIFFIPLGIYWLLERVCQNIVIPSAGGFLFRSLCRVNSMLQSMYVARIYRWLEKKDVTSADRVVLQYDHLRIDTLKLTFPGARGNRWMLVSLGNAESIEGYVIQHDLRGIVSTAKKAHANLLFFNYPGVCYSKGPVSVSNLVHAYQGCLRYLRDEDSGPKAKEIIAYGYSLGASVQAEALSQEITDNRDGVSWFVIKDRGARSLAAVAKQWLGPVGAQLTKCLGWNIDSEKHSHALRCPELFTCSVDENRQLIGDGLFSKDTCFAAAFFPEDKRAQARGKKISIEQVYLNHVEPLCVEAEDLIAEAIRDHFG